MPLELELIIRMDDTRYQKPVSSKATMAPALPLRKKIAYGEVSVVSDVQIGLTLADEKANAVINSKSSFDARRGKYPPPSSTHCFLAAFISLYALSIFKLHTPLIISLHPDISSLKELQHSFIFTLALNKQ